MTIRLHPSAGVLRRLGEVARGRREPDLVISGGALVDVFSEEILEGWGLAVAEGRIAYVGPDAEKLAGAATETIDLGGDLVAPGLIEGHTHLTRLRMSDLADLQLRAGVTTSIIESAELAIVCGAAGVRELLRAAGRLPARFFFTIPALMTFEPEHEVSLGSAEDWIELLDDPAAIGVGELYWAELLRGHDRADRLIEAALERGLTVEGHGAGAKPAVLNAMAGLGVASDHEGIDADDLVNRVRVGLYGMIRQGATRQDLPAIAAAWDRVDCGRLSLVTDGVEPEDMLAHRSLNAVVDLAVAHGLPLARAVRLATRNAAERLGCGRWLGGIGPGMLADLAVIPRQGGFRPRLVLVGGRRPLPAVPHRYPDAMLRTLATFAAPPPEFLAHPGPGRWRAMELVAPTVTREVESDGTGALIAALVDRRAGRGFRGLLLGFGLHGGGIALSSGWEATGVTAVGDRPADLALAIECVRELGGGAAVAAGGRLLASWRAPVAGLYSDQPARAALDQVAAVNGAARALGAVSPNPLLTIETLTTAAIPHLRLCSSGYVRLRDGARLGLEWN